MAMSLNGTALKFNPDNPKSKANVGFGMLGQRKWEGWDYYSYSLGLAQRIKFQYGDEPEWNGAEVQSRQSEVEGQCRLWNARSEKVGRVGLLLILARAGAAHQVPIWR